MQVGEGFETHLGRMGAGKGRKRVWALLPVEALGSGGWSVKVVGGCVYIIRDGRRGVLCWQVMHHPSREVRGMVEEPSLGKVSESRRRRMGRRDGMRGSMGPGVGARDEGRPALPSSELSSRVLPERYNVSEMKRRGPGGHVCGAPLVCGKAHHLGTWLLPRGELQVLDLLLEHLHAPANFFRGRRSRGIRQLGRRCLICCTKSRMIHQIREHQPGR